MKYLNRILSLASCVALLPALAPAAHADTVTGYFWNSSVSGIVPCSGNSSPTTPGNCTGVQGAVPASIPSTASATASFTVSNPNGAGLIDFYSTTDIGLTSFLTTGFGGGSNGDTVSYLTGGATQATQDLNDGLFEFTGTTTLSAGEQIFVQHDDGANLYLNGVPVIFSPGPTASGFNVYTVGAAGTYNWVLDYTESNAAPADLISNIAAPEPSSLVLLGTGVLAAAGAIRRRVMA